MTEEKSLLYRWKDSAGLWAFVFTAWPCFVLIAFDYALLYPIIAIGVVAIFVYVWRGMALFMCALGMAMCFAGFWSLALLVGHNGEPIGSLQLMPAIWTWFFSALLLLFGIPLLFVWATKVRGECAR